MSAPSRWAVRVAFLREALRADLQTGVTRERARVPVNWWKPPKADYGDRRSADAAVSHTFRVAAAAYRKVRGPDVPYPPLLRTFFRNAREV